MIELITGLPGNAKSLYAVSRIRERAKKENREVYYSGITLTEQGQIELGWKEVDPEKWMECPPGSIILIDECQRIYRNRSINTIPPKFVTELETHRHLGVDLVFITQHPMLVDPALRRLTGKHLHCVRTFGMERSVVHEWGQVRENCDKPVGRKDSIQHHWTFDKSVYSLYKSAELHTMKRNIPMKIKLLPVLFLVLAALVWKGYDSFKGRATGADVQKVKGMESAVPVGAPARAQSGGGGGSEVDPVADAKAYIFRETPRVQQIQHTAPKYDEITRPKRVPIPAMCIMSGQRCQCYTQQGTKLDTPYNMCLDVAHNGFFQEFDPDGEQRRENAQAALDRADGRLPLSGADTTQRPYVASFGTEDGYGVLGRRGVNGPAGTAGSVLGGKS